jgi:hypothetical protein
MAATESPEATRTRQGPPASASPLDQHAPPTASTGRRSGRAVTALILGTISIPAAIFPPAGLILGIIAVVLGGTARSDITRNRLLGGGQATAAIVLGAIGIVLALALWVIGAIMTTQ